MTNFNGTELSPDPVQGVDPYCRDEDGSDCLWSQSCRWKDLDIKGITHWDVISNETSRLRTTNTLTLIFTNDFWDFGIVVLVLPSN